MSMNYPTLKQFLDNSAQQQQDQVSSRFSYNLAPVILNQSTSGLPQTVDTGLFNGGWIVISNESPWDIQVIQGGINRRVKAGMADKVQTFQRIVYIQPTLLLPQGSPSSQVDIEVYPIGEPPGYFPMTLARQSAPISASVKFGYSNNVIVSGAGPFQMFNVFNPANSGKNYIFYSAPCDITTGTAITGITMETLVGPDVNLANSAGAAQPHDSNAPTSLAHCTFGTGALPANALIGQVSFLDASVGVTSQLLQNGDLCITHPGQNAFIFANTTTQTLVSQLSWWEQ